MKFSIRDSKESLFGIIFVVNKMMQIIMKRNVFLTLLQSFFLTELKEYYWKEFCTHAQKST